MAGELTLGEFVKIIAVRIHEEGLKLPFKEEAPWHYLFYELKKAPDLSDKPAFFRRLRFDWDGAYPRCQELSEFIQALHWTGSVTVGNPSYDQIMLNDDLSAKWKEEESEFIPADSAFLARGIDIAKREFTAQ
jgi:hypothetical protein